MRKANFPESIPAERVFTQVGKTPMVPDTKNWRSFSAYDFMDEAHTDDLAWECLRRNAKYQSDFASFFKSPTSEYDLTDPLLSGWGLRFPCTAQPYWHRTNGLLDA